MQVETMERLKYAINYQLITINTMEMATDKALGILLKEPFREHTVTSIAEAMNISRPGTWKALKKLEADKMIISEAVGTGKTSTARIKLNWNNPVTEKTLSLLITKEALNYERWMDNFSSLKDYSEFLVLFGSILTKPKEANDIDLLAIVKTKEDYSRIDEAIRKIQLTQSKKIHMIDLSKEELASELKKSNKAYLDAIKKGIILYGQNEYLEFIRRLRNE
jgi:DNA-binding Lrp family transcriptional regulator